MQTRHKSPASGRKVFHSASENEPCSPAGFLQPKLIFDFTDYFTKS